MASGNGCDGSSLTGQSKQIILLKASKGPEDPYSKVSGPKTINSARKYVYISDIGICWF